ncbi:hypothetical protein GF336_04155 [Candidatus Woesearchaeota archaeon]|nr:hypothetical protein [Candidatus Woesearchaeota archaeon]
MDRYERFYESLRKAAERFKSIDNSETIRIISHLDADGITAGAIIINLMNEENRKYSISILQQLDREKVSELAKEDFKHYIFTDLGSGQINDIKDIMKEKKIIILDHHEIEDISAENITHINPHLFDIDGSHEVSGAGVVYLFARTVDERYKNIAHLAIIGALGDVQEEQGFKKLNHDILQDAVEKGNLSLSKGLRVFGSQTKPIHKVLEYSTDPYIPGVSGSESGAIQFLHQIGINPKDKKGWRKLIHLNEEEMKKLVAGVIMKRFGETSPEDVLGNIYTLPNEKEGSTMRDAREFATLLNACGRLDRASLGIGACLGIKEEKRKALKTLDEYKKEIVKAINWYHDNKKISDIKKGKNYMIINARDNVLSTIIGTLASIVSKSNDIDENTYIMSLARTDKETTKVSLRISSRKNQEDGGMRGVMKEITDKVGGEAGGHMHAAGALVPVEKEEEFIAAAEDILKQKTAS